MSRAAAVIAAALAACGGTVKSSIPDAEDDTVPDTSADTSVDPAPGDAPDVAPETASDTGTDVPDDPGPPPGAVGDPCTDASDCASVPGEGRMCIESIPMGPGGSWEFPGGYCSAQCNVPTDCGAGADCVPMMMGSAICLERCESNEDCRGTEGYTCRDLPGPSPTPVTYCLPPM